MAGVCLAVGLVYFILGLGCRKMGRESFKLSGVEAPATAADGSASSPPAPGGGAKTAGGVPSGNAYGSASSGAYEEPAAIKAARQNASAYSNEAPPSYGAEPAAYSNEGQQSAYSNDQEQV